MNSEDMEYSAEIIYYTVLNILLWCFVLLEALQLFVIAMWI